MNLNRLEYLFLVLYFQFRQLKGTREIKKKTKKKKTPKAENKTLSDEEVTEFNSSPNQVKHFRRNAHSQLLYPGLDFDIQRLFAVSLGLFKRLNDEKNVSSPKKIWRNLLTSCTGKEKSPKVAQPVRMEILKLSLVLGVDLYFVGICVCCYGNLTKFFALECEIWGWEIENTHNEYTWQEWIICFSLPSPTKLSADFHILSSHCIFKSKTEWKFMQPCVLLSLGETKFMCGNDHE